MRDPALYSSGFDRIEGERYFTEPRFTRALLPFIPDYVRDNLVWEPAAGRGDIVRVLRDNGFDCNASDVDVSQFDDAWEGDFLSYTEAEDVTAIITNPPYGKGMAEKFVRHALSLGVPFVAMFLRSEFNSAGGRSDLWKPPFAFEVVMTQRPRWDWWMETPGDSSPRHCFSWFVWDQQWQVPPTQYFTGAK